jgi:hypothetical protein
MVLALYILAGCLSAGLCVFVGFTAGSRGMADSVLNAAEAVRMRRPTGEQVTYAQAYSALFRELGHEVENAGPK